MILKTTEFNLESVSISSNKNVQKRKINLHCSHVRKFGEQAQSYAHFHKSFLFIRLFKCSGFYLLIDLYQTC